MIAISHWAFREWIGDPLRQTSSEQKFSSMATPSTQLCRRAFDKKVREIVYGANSDQCLLASDAGAGDCGCEAGREAQPKRGIRSPIRACIEPRGQDVPGKRRRRSADHLRERRAAHGFPDRRIVEAGHTSNQRIPGKRRNSSREWNGGACDRPQGQKITGQRLEWL